MVLSSNGLMSSYLFAQTSVHPEGHGFENLGLLRFVVQFVVERDGSIAGANVVKGIGAGCDEEALRVVRSMPKWQPGKQRGQPVRVQFNLPIRFKLE